MHTFPRLICISKNRFQVEELNQEDADPFLQRSALNPSSRFTTSEFDTSSSVWGRMSNKSYNDKFSLTTCPAWIQYILPSIPPPWAGSHGQQSKQRNPVLSVPQLHPPAYPGKHQDGGLRHFQDSQTASYGFFQCLGLPSPIFLKYICTYTTEPISI